MLSIRDWLTSLVHLLWVETLLDDLTNGALVTLRLALLAIVATDPVVLALANPFLAGRRCGMLRRSPARRAVADDDDDRNHNA